MDLEVDVCANNRTLARSLEVGIPGLSSLLPLPPHRDKVVIGLLLVMEVL